MAQTSPTSAADRPAPAGRRTIGALWREATLQPHERPAYLVEGDGAWREISWEEAARSVDELAHGLLALGVRKGEAFAILARTRLEWALFDFALALVGAVGAPIYPSSSAREVAYILEHSESVGVLAEDDEQLEKVGAARADDSSLRHVLGIDELDGLRARGREHAAAHPTALADACAGVTEHDLFTYIYTSGTTGPPKGCMIRHRNYYAMVANVAEVSEFYDPADTMLLYLPLAHNFGRLLHLTGPYVGFTTAFVPDPLRVAEVLPAVRPTILPSVPRVYEKIQAAVQATFDEATGPKRRVIDWALGVGRRTSALRQQRRSVPPVLAAQHRLADRLVFSKVKERLGGRLRLTISGGAPLAREIAEFFHTLDLLILEGYGLTECTTAATVNRPERFRFGTVGPALPGVELAIASDGEILIRGETVFAGYLKDETATREVLGEDGWLRSGDVGELDGEGFLRITDRKKDLIVTSGGKNLAPQNIENGLKLSRFVSQALVVGDRRPYVTALITLEEDALAGWAAARDLSGGTAELAGDERVRELVQDAVDGVNRELSRFEQIKRFAILPRDFSQEEGEVTPTLKLRRRVCESHFAEQIDRLYQKL